LQGLHQAAQNSIKVYFPLASSRDNISPSGVGPSKSGAFSPIFNIPVCVKLSASEQCALELFKPNPKSKKRMEERKSIFFMVFYLKDNYTFYNYTTFKIIFL